MKYITLEEFYGFVVAPEVVKLTEGKNGVPDLDVLEEVNRTAVAELEGYLRGLYRLPLPDPPEDAIRGIMGELMRFYLRTRRNDQNVSDSVFKLYQLAVGKLKDIQTKKIVLNAPALAGEGENAILGGTVQSWTPTQKFKNHFTGFDGLQIVVIGLCLCLASCGSSKKATKRTAALELEQHRATIEEVLTAVRLEDDMLLDFRIVETADSAGNTRKETTGTLNRKMKQEGQQEKATATTEQTQQQASGTEEATSNRVYQSPWLWIALTVGGVLLLAALFLFFKDRITGFLKPFKTS